MTKVAWSGSRRGYTGSVARRKIYCEVIICLFCVSLARAQDDSEQQALKRAVELHQSGHYAEAITEYQTYLKAHPQAVAVRSNLGAALAHEGRYTEAIQEYKLALTAEPSNYGIRLNLGLAYYKMNEIEEAIKEFEAVYAIQPASDPERRRLLLLMSECY